MIEQSNSLVLEVVIAAAEPFAKCQHEWGRMGYGGNYSCLDREIDIANPEHQTLDWWPHQGRCDGCNLSEALGKVGVGTLPWRELQAKMKEDEQRQTYERLRNLYEKEINA